MELLFVYGTLRPGSQHPVAARLADQATHLGRATCAGELHDFGDHPGLLPGPGKVLGDLYRLDDPATLVWLDEYEELAAPPKPLWFTRERREVVGPDGRPVQAWVYPFHGRGAPTTHLPSGDYLAPRPPTWTGRTERRLPQAGRGAP